MKIGMFGLMGAAALASAANADFAGWGHQLITLGNGHTIMNVYARFTNANDRVLSCYNANVSTNVAGGFFQGPNAFWQAGNTQNKLTGDDSWVNIGTNPNGSGNAGGNGGTTVADPNFVNFTDANDSTDFSFIEGTGGGAGWYNGNPANTYGYAFESFNNAGNDGAPTTMSVLVAHFVVASLAEGQGPLEVSWNASLTVYLNGATGSTTGIGTGANHFAWIIPAPGALALLGVAGIATRRRRA